MNRGMLEVEIDENHCTLVSQRETDGEVNRRERLAAGASGAGNTKDVKPGRRHLCPDA